MATRHTEVVAALASLDDDEIGLASRLPGWTRLTIACHLRYGALASARLSDDALAGRPTAFYPDGRDRQRTATLHPDDGEAAAEVVRSLATTSERLDQRWAGLVEDQWAIEVNEPPDNRDLGSISLWTLALLRLTEVEVHGHDLGLGLSPWSTTFVDAALPTRLRWLPSRRSNHQAADVSIDHRWALVATDGLTFLIAADGARVDVEAFDSADEAVERADTTLTGTARQLLAFILGRASLDELQIDGGRAGGAAFLLAFPAP